MLSLAQMDRRTTICPLPSTAKDSFSTALDAISVTTELVEDELKPHLETLLTAAVERKRGLAEQVVRSGILPVLAQALRRKSPLTLHTARLLAELAREAPVRDSCFETGIVSALLALLLSEDQDLLLHGSRAIGRICYNSNLQQDRLLRLGVVPRLVTMLLQYCENEVLLSSCLLALCNLADMGDEDSSTLVWEKRAHYNKEELVFYGTSKYPFGFVSAVTVVRLNQRSQGQCSVIVEMLPCYSTLFWEQRIRQDTDRHLPSFRHLGCFSNFYNVIKYFLKSLPKKKSLKSAVFHTFL